MNRQQKKRHIGIGLFIAAIAVFVVLVGSEFIGGQTFGEAEGDLVGGAVPNEASQDAVNVEVRFPPSGFLSSPRTETWSRNGDQWTFLHSTGSRPSGDLALPRRSSTDISQHLSGATWAQEAGSDRVYLTPTSGNTPQSFVAAAQTGALTPTSAPAVPTGNSGPSIPSESGSQTQQNLVYVKAANGDLYPFSYDEDTGTLTIQGNSMPLDDGDNNPLTQSALVDTTPTELAKYELEVFNDADGDNPIDVTTHFSSSGTSTSQGSQTDPSTSTSPPQAQTDTDTAPVQASDGDSTSTSDNPPTPEIPAPLELSPELRIDFSDPAAVTQLREQMEENPELRKQAADYLRRANIPFLDVRSMSSVFVAHALADKDGDGSLSNDELVVFVNNLPDARLDDAMANADKDGDGFISTDELIAAVQSVNDDVGEINEQAAEDEAAVEQDSEDEDMTFEEFLESLDKDREEREKEGGLPNDPEILEEGDPGFIGPAKPPTYKGGFFLDENGKADLSGFRNVFKHYKSTQAISTLLINDAFKSDWIEEVDKAFTENFLGVEYWRSEICKFEPDTNEGGVGLVEVAPDIFQFIGHIEGEISEPLPMLCDEENECAEGTCRLLDFRCVDDKGDGDPTNDQLKTEHLFKITFGVSAPTDEDLTPNRNENGAVAFNIVLTATGKTGQLFDKDVELQNGGNVQHTIVDTRPTLYTQACLQFSKPAEDYKGDKVRSICANMQGVDQRFITRDNTGPVNIPGSICPTCY